MKKSDFAIKPAYDDAENMKMLISEYIGMLLAMDNSFRDYLCIQNYDEEIQNLNGKYGLPGGRLYIAYAGGEAAGCIALRRMDETRCEMKRLYVRPQFRGNGLAGDLVERIVSDAKEIGYKAMLLDTLPELGSATRLYEGIGFYRIPPYNDSPIAKTVFMKLDLE